MAAKKKVKKAAKKKTPSTNNCATDSATCIWSNNHLACVNTWGMLRGLGQLRPDFSSSKLIPMDKLEFWNPAAGGDVNRLQAQAIASQLDKLFINALAASYEPGFNTGKAVTGMTDILADRSQKLCNLAPVVDAAYKFRGEA